MAEEKGTELQLAEGSAAPQEASAGRGADLISDKPSGAGINIFNWAVVCGICGYLYYISHYALILVLVGMSPALFGLVADKRFGHFATRTVGTFNFMGVLPFLFQLFMAPERAEAAKRLVTDFKVWVFIFSATILGALLVWIIPQIASAVFMVRANMRISKLEAMQQSLINEWGEEILEEE